MHVQGGNLDGHRILDLTKGSGFLVGKLLGDFGAIPDQELEARHQVSVVLLDAETETNSIGAAVRRYAGQEGIR